jgi:Cof subfamily protein (haloacid dehalogenase superfamily)
MARAEGTRSRTRLTPARGLLAVDLDGTLLDSRGKPHAKDVRALRMALKAGVKVSILTGRLYSGTRATAEALDLTGPVGCVDGSHVVDASTHTTLYHHGIVGKDARILRDSVAKGGPAAFLFAKDVVVHDAAGEEYLSYVSTWSTDLRRATRVVDHELWEARDGVTAVVAVGTPEQISETVELIRASLPEVAQVAMFPLRRTPGSWGMIVRAAGGTKGTALKWLAKHHGIALENTVCVGDWLNDVAMFSVAGRSFAMGQAPDEVKRAATDVLVETHDEGGGIAKAVERAFGLVVAA